MSQYDILDTAIVESLRQKGTIRLCDLQGGEVHKEAYRLSENTGREEFRILDARLTVLKKRGLIEYKKGWRLVSRDKP